jgi:hypothetical protein
LFLRAFFEPDNSRIWEDCLVRVALPGESREIERFLPRHKRPPFANTFCNDRASGSHRPEDASLPFDRYKAGRGLLRSEMFNKLPATPRVVVDTAEDRNCRLHDLIL